MKNENKTRLLLSVIMTMLPAILVAVLSTVIPLDKAPSWMGEHVAKGNLANIALMAILDVVNALCLIWTEKTNKDKNKKVKSIVYCIVPLISHIVMFFYAAFLFGFADNSEKLMVLVFAIMFIFLGNYLPKTEQNTTIGIKIKWTLQNKRNWDATHRFAGKLWVLGGFLMILLALLPGNIAIISFVAIILVLAFIPMIYSYVFYKKQMGNGSYVVEGEHVQMKKSMKVLSGTVLFMILAAVAVLLFAGGIDYSFEEDYVLAEVSFFSDLKLEYDEIDSIELVDHKIGGTRIMGLGTMKLAAGSFKNEEIGMFSSYRYVGTDNSVLILTRSGEKIVMSAKDENETIELYNELLKRI